MVEQPGSEEEEGVEQEELGGLEGRQVQEVGSPHDLTDSESEDSGNENSDSEDGDWDEEALPQPKKKVMFVIDDPEEVRMYAEEEQEMSGQDLDGDIPPTLEEVERRPVTVLFKGGKEREDVHEEQAVEVAQVEVPPHPGGWRKQEAVHKQRGQ